MMMTRDEIATLTMDVHEDILGVKPRTLPTRKRTHMVGTIAELVAMERIAIALPGSRVMNANDVRRNNPGYDLLVDDRVRIQVKGSAWVELIGWSHVSDVKDVGLDYDAVAFVDLGCCIDGRVGRLTHILPAPRTEPDIYIVPVTDVRAFLTRPQAVLTAKEEP
jgi:hypothetical protein